MDVSKGEGEGEGVRAAESNPLPSPQEGGQSPFREVGTKSREGKV